MILLNFIRFSLTIEPPAHGGEIIIN